MSPAPQGRRASLLPASKQQPTDAVTAVSVYHLPTPLLLWLFTPLLLLVLVIYC